MVRWKWGCGEACRIHLRSLRRGWRESLEDLVDVFRLDLAPRGRAGWLSIRTFAFFLFLFPSKKKSRSVVVGSIPAVHTVYVKQ